MPPEANEPKEDAGAGLSADDPWPIPEEPDDGEGIEETDDPTLGHDQLVALRSSRHVARRPRRRRRWPWIAAVAVVLLGAVSYGIFAFVWPIAQDVLITRNVSSAAAGYPALTTAFAEGIATVSGDIATSADAEAVIASIQRVDGVDEVQMNLTVASDSDTNTLESMILQALMGADISTVTPIVEGSRITLIGSAPDSATVDLASTVTVGVEGVSQVLNRVVVAADSAAAAQGILQAAGYSSIAVAIGGGVAVLTGTVASEEEALAVADLVMNLPGIEKVDNRVAVGEVTETVPADHPIGTADTLVSAALIDAGYDSVIVTFDGDLAYMDGVVPFEVLEDGYFAFVEDVRSIVQTVGGAETIVNRLRLRGNEQELRAELKELLDLTPIVFLSGSSDLTVDSEGALEGAAKIILSQPGLQIFIAGHTDSSGSAESNEQLARERGGVVYGYLVSLGVPSNRMAVVSYGELFPGEGDTSADDRRIEFEVGP